MTVTASTRCGTCQGRGYVKHARAPLGLANTDAFLTANLTTLPCPACGGGYAV